MALMDWDPARFDVRVARMNLQHQNLVAVMNHLYDQHRAGAKKPELSAILVKLRDATLQHFRDEEAFLDSIKFPETVTHKTIHRDLVANFTKHYQAFEAGTGQISGDFFGFLKLWLTAHIMHVDRKYGEHAKKIGQA